MAIVTRLYFATPDYSASYDYDDSTLKLVGVHVTNSTGSDLIIEVRRASNDTTLLSHTFHVGQTDLTLTAPQQQAVTLNAQGKPTNIYAQTV